MPTLYVVPTPIGNLEDITQRALRILREVDLIAAEDTRTTGKLLKRYSIETPQLSFHEFSDDGRVDRIVERLASGDVALVSDAGTPAVSDPGYRLINAALEAGHAVTPLPGANAAVTALVASGLPTDSFLFLGFLPKQKVARRTALTEVASVPHTLVLYESPNRLAKLLTDVDAVLGDRQICVARELTKLHEEIFRGTVRQAQQHFDKTVRGEVTVVIAGAQTSEVRWERSQVREQLKRLLEQGMARKRAAAQVAAQSGWRPKEVYAVGLDD